jgi:hypothetical protein
MNPSRGPTKAAIDAALSAYYGEVDEAARKNALAPGNRRASTRKSSQDHLISGASGQSRIAELSFGWHAEIWDLGLLRSNPKSQCGI